MHAEYGCVPDGIDEDLLQYSVLIDHDQRLIELENIAYNHYVVIELILLSLAFLCVVVGLMAWQKKPSQRGRRRSRRRKVLEWEGKTLLLIPNLNFET
jgi:hypothetical protein